LPVTGPFAALDDPLLLVAWKESAMLRVLTVCLIGLVGLISAPLIALGATIYKVELPDGSILFTDSPPPGAKILEERETKSASRAAPPRSVAGSQAPAATGIPPGSTVVPLKGPANLEAAMAEISAAERELAVARRKLELGREPLPGERLGLKGGGSRLSPEYEARVGELEKEVSAAEARLKRAYEARNALR
jgi:hypothetical protein